MLPQDRTPEQAYKELKEVADKLLTRALAFSPRAGAEDGPGALALPGLLAALRSAADDLASIKIDHERAMGDADDEDAEWNNAKLIVLLKKMGLTAVERDAVRGVYPAGWHLATPSTGNQLAVSPLPFLEGLKQLGLTQTQREEVMRTYHGESIHAARVEASYYVNPQFAALAALPTKHVRSAA